MDIGKIVRLVAILFAIAAGLANIPEEGAIIAVLGLIGGWFIEEEYSTRFLVGVLALALANGALNDIPALGVFLTNVLTAVSALFNAAAVMVIAKGVFARLKP